MFLKQIELVQKSFESNEKSQTAAQSLHQLDPDDPASVKGFILRLTIEYLKRALQANPRNSLY